MSGLDGCVNSRIRQIVILFRKCLAIKEAMSYGTICYDNFFKSWHEEYEYWADNEDAIREELHHNQYEDRLYYENGDVYVEPLNEIA